VVASFIDNLDLTNVILIIGLVGILVKSVGEGRGWFRSAAALRVENTDILRRNGELEGEIQRKETALAADVVQIATLEKSIRELQKLDQSAVLGALTDHELNAERRAERTQMLQSEGNQTLERIAAVLDNSYSSTDQPTKGTT